MLPKSTLKTGTAVVPAQKKSTLRLVDSGDVKLSITEQLQEALAYQNALAVWVLVSDETVKLRYEHLPVLESILHNLDTWDFGEYKKIKRGLKAELRKLTQRSRKHPPESIRIMVATGER